MLCFVWALTEDVADNCSDAFCILKAVVRVWFSDSKMLKRVSNTHCVMHLINQIGVSCSRLLCSELFRKLIIAWCAAVLPFGKLRSCVWELHFCICK